jgi:hypothetical protein
MKYSNTKTELLAVAVFPTLFAGEEISTEN